MITTTLDIETVLNGPYDEIVAIPERDGMGGVIWKPQAKFAPLPMHIPEVIVWLVADGDQLEMKIFDRGEDSETAKLKEIATDLRRSRRLVTVNGRGFDMPLLGLRAMRAGVDWSFWDALRHRFPNYKKALYHYDMQDQLGDYGAARAISLDRTAKLLGYAGKRDVCGSDVGELIAAGKRNEVITYCCDDVIQTRLIYLHFCISHLGQDAKIVRASIDSTLEFARNHEYLGALYGSA